MRTGIYVVAGLLICGPRALANDGHPNIWSFTGTTDGASPRGTLLVDAQGNLYGTTSTGGTADDGTVFIVVPAADGVSPASQKTIWNFSGPDGSLPSAGLVADGRGNLYGTTALDGTSLGGTAFELSPPASGQSVWSETKLWSFGAGHDGRNPVGDLLFGSGGVLFGTTMWGGAHGHGSVFELVPPHQGESAWTEKVIWDFTGGVDGSEPAAAVIADRSGALYGTTKLGGASNDGTVFKLSLKTGAWAQTTLWSFTGHNDGAQPSSSLLIDDQGALYGTARFGGIDAPTCAQSRFPYYGEPQNQNRPALLAPYIPIGGNRCGTVFKLFPGRDILKTIYQFQGTPDGGGPVAGMAALADGSLVGFTTEYGEMFYGAVFRLFPPAALGQPWTHTEPTSFNAMPEGLYARGAPVSGVAGRIYGSMVGGGKTWVHLKVFGFGTVFSVAP